MPTPRNRPELKLLYGAEPRELVTEAPKPAHREPQAPGWLTIEQRRIWDLVTTELREMGQLFAADTYELVNYCIVTSHAHRLARELDRETDYTVMLEGPAARPMLHPLVSGLDRLMARSHTLAKHLGLNPAGRSAIHGRSTAKPNTEQAHVTDLYA